MLQNTLFHPEYVDLREVVFTFHIERCDDCKPDQINLLTAGTDYYNGWRNLCDDVG